MPKMICICILLIYFKVISKKGVTIAPAYPALNISAGPLALCTFQTAGPVRASTLYLSLARQDHRVKCRASRLKITVAHSMTNFATFSCILFHKIPLCMYCLTSVHTFLRKLFLTTLSSLCVISHEYRRRSGKNGGQ